MMNEGLGGGGRGGRGRGEVEQDDGLGDGGTRGGWGGRRRQGRGGGGGRGEVEEDDGLGDGGSRGGWGGRRRRGRGGGGGRGEVEEDDGLGDGGSRGRWGGRRRRGGGEIEEDEGLGGGGRGGGGRGGNEGGHGYDNIGGRRRRLLISEKKCIFKVPKHIREADKIAYTPQWVSIGPYHYGNPNLSYMESQKKSFLASTRWDPDRRSSLRATILEFEVRVRRCYSQNFNHIDSRTFGEIMLTDAFFIIHLFLAYDIWCKDDKELPDHPIFTTTRWRLPNLCQDLLMLENQLPFFILVQVFAILTNESESCLKELAIQFFKQVSFGKVAVRSKRSRFKPPKNTKHLLDFFHSSFVQVDIGKRKRKRSTSSPLRMETKHWVQNTSALKSNGVRFIGIKGNPLDIEFSQLGTLRIPTFCINDRTISVLKNLVAYEQGSPLANPYFTCLAIFFSNIAAAPDDIKTLREAGIIQHQPADDETVLLLLQQLYRATEYSFNDCLIKNQVERIDKYVTSGRVKFMGALRREVLANGIRFIVLFLTLFFSLSVNPFRQRR